VEELVESGLADGRILPSMEAWARGLAATSTQALRDYLNTAAPIAALVATQTSGLAPAGASGKAALNDGELAVCKAMGLSTDEFLAARDGEKKGE
jgi:phage I-like protein